MAWSERPGVPALLISGVIFADALAARWLLRADEERVYVLGRPIEWVCALRSRYGLPCPTCGMTRSIVMSLHGEFARAWHVAPAGPVAVAGVLGFAMALAVSQWIGAWGNKAGPRTWLRRGALIYAAAAMVIWLGGWMISFRAALASR